MTMMRNVMALGACALLAACATAQRPKYDWAGYDEALYGYYKHPADNAPYMASLKAAIDHADKNHQRVPPGICAEYGYMLMQQKKYDEAASYFEQEKQAWPESASFMDGMIKSAHAGGHATSGNVKS